MKLYVGMVLLLVALVMWWMAGELLVALRVFGMPGR